MKLVRSLCHWRSPQPHTLYYDNNVVDVQTYDTSVTLCRVWKASMEIKKKMQIY
jgi:hypothetical protein